MVFFVTYKEVADSEKIASANFVLKISEKLDSSHYEKILKIIEDNPSNYQIIGKRSDDITSNDIEDFIGNFETLGDLMRCKVIDERMAYDELGYDVEKAWCNKDVRRVVEEARQADNIPSGPKAFYAGFEAFAKYSLARDKKSCEDMDRE